MLSVVWRNVKWKPPAHSAAGAVNINLVSPNGIGGCSSCYTYVGAIIITGSETSALDCR